MVGRSGLGNRILCTLTAIQYARLSGRRLVVDWSDYFFSTDGSNVFSRLFYSELIDPEEVILGIDSVWPPLWSGHLHEAPHFLARHLRWTKYRNFPEVWRRYSFDLERLDYPHRVLVMWAYIEEIDRLRRHFIGELASLRRTSTRTILKKLMRENLFLQPEIQARIEAFQKERFDGPTVGVHVRYTDKRARLDAIFQRLRALMECRPDLKVFLATDNRQIVDLFKQSYPSVITTSKWLPPSGMPIHKSFLSQDSFQECVEALVDMYLLAACDYLIIDESSSFSYMAGVLSNQPEDHIFNMHWGRCIPKPVRNLLWVKWQEVSWLWARSRGRI